MMMHFQHTKEGISSLVTWIILWKSTFAHGIIVAPKNRNESCHHINLRGGQGSTVSHSLAVIESQNLTPFAMTHKIQEPSASKQVGSSGFSRLSLHRNSKDHDSIWDMHRPHPLQRIPTMVSTPTRTDRIRRRVVDKICSPGKPKTIYRAEKWHHGKLTRLNCLQFPAGSASATIGDAAMPSFPVLAGVTAADIALPSTQPGVLDPASGRTGTPTRTSKPAAARLSSVACSPTTYSPSSGADGAVAAGG
jgi:hypothetical protein